MPASARRSTQKARSGRSRTSTRHLGTRSVNGRSRVPSPPASKSALTRPELIGMVWFLPESMYLIVDEYVPAAVTSDPKWQLPGTVQSLANRPVSPRRCDEQQESSTAGAKQFTAHCACLAGRFVPTIHLVVADTESERPLQLPAV